jgi:hypothetical protein
MKRNSILFVFMMLMLSAVLWSQTAPPNCSVATYQITNVSVPDKSGCTGWQGYTGTGYAYYETMTLHVEGYQTQTGAIYASANLPLSQIGHCWVLMSAPYVKDCRPLYYYNKTTPPTATGTNYDMINFQSIDGVKVAGGTTCGISYGARQFWQCLAKACKDGGVARTPQDPCTPKVAQVVRPQEGLLANLFRFSWTTHATVCTDSPIVIDLSGKGFKLTDAKNGVSFDIEGTGEQVQMGWTAQGAANAFLALPGPDGLVHNGKQLFGNFTPQPQSDDPNGFDALRVYDTNNDGVIDARDPVFKSLRLWVDDNHDGISQPGELHTLTELGVNSISLKYHEDRWHDQYGNAFRYRAKINDDTTDKWTYDVFFVADDGGKP